MNEAQVYANKLVANHPVPAELLPFWKRDSEMVANRVNWLRDSLEGAPRYAVASTPVILLPTGDINACAATVPGQPEQAVVILEMRLSLALEFMIDLAFWALFDENQTDEKKEIAIAQALCDLYALPILDSGTLRVPEFVQDQKAYPAKVLLLSNAITFILGHELAHVSEGHLGQAQRIKRRVRSEEIETFTYDQQLELDADHIGFEWLINASPTLEGPVLASPLLVCSLFAAHDHIGTCLTGQDPSQSTHPSGFDRFNRLIREFESTLDESAVMLAKVFHERVFQALFRLKSCDLTDLERCMRMLRGDA